MLVWFSVGPDEVSGLRPMPADMVLGAYYAGIFSNINIIFQQMELILQFLAKRIAVDAEELGGRALIVVAFAQCAGD